MAIVRYTPFADYDPANFTTANLFGLDTENFPPYQIFASSGQRLGFQNGRSNVDLDDRVGSFNSGVYADFTGTNLQVILGTGNKADTLIGGSGANTLNAGGGDDTMIGTVGTDAFNGGDGNDTVSYARSTAGVEVYLDGSAPNTNDALGDTFASIERLIGTDFNDLLTGTGGNDRLVGGTGNDILDGGDGNDTLVASVSVADNAVDRLYGGIGTDTAIVDIPTGPGTAVLDTLLGNVSLIAASQERASFTSVESIRVNLTDLQKLTVREVGAIDVTIVGDGGSNRAQDSVNTGAAEADILTRITFDGGAGDDVFSANAGYDHIVFSGTGNAIVNFSFSDYTVDTTTYASGVSLDGYGDTDSAINVGLIDEMTTGSGNDTVVANASGMKVSTGGGADRIVATGAIGAVDGGAGDDTLSLSGTAAPTSLTSVERVVLSDGADIDLGSLSQGQALVRSFSTAGGSVTIRGSGFADNIAGGAGADTLLGAGGNDTITVFNTGTVVDGGIGTDTLTLKLASGSTATYDATSLKGVERINLANGVSLDVSAVTTGVSVVTGKGAAAVTIDGTAATDFLRGASGDDVLNGGGGNDNLQGNVGDDLIAGGTGADTMSGGTGADTFVFATLASMSGPNGKGGTTTDRISDLDGDAGDRIDLSAIDADGDGANGIQHFAFIGTNAFSGGNDGAEVRIRPTAAATVFQVQLDGDGNGTVDAAFVVISARALVEADFILAPPSEPIAMAHFIGM